MRSAASRRSAVSDFDGGTRLAHARALLLGRRMALRRRMVRPQPEQMADRVDEIGAVHGVEVEFGDAVIDQVDHLLGGDRGGDQLARRRIVVEAVEALGEPGRHRGAGARGEIPASA